MKRRKYLTMDELKVGMRVRYYSERPDAMDANDLLGESSTTIIPHAIYDAEIIQITKYLIVLRMMINVELSERHEVFSNRVKPYSWSICKNDLFNREHLYIIEDVPESINCNNKDN